jgi:hypothetical protein
LGQAEASVAFKKISPEKGGWLVSSPCDPDPDPAIFVIDLSEAKKKTTVIF